MISNQIKLEYVFELRGGINIQSCSTICYGNEFSDIQTSATVAATIAFPVCSLLTIQITIYFK